jgi:hypothetical protein
MHLFDWLPWRRRRLDVRRRRLGRKAQGVRAREAETERLIGGRR